MITKTIPWILAALILATAPVDADDWPSFRGPDRNGHSAETGLLARWPAGGPKQLWKVEGLGDGYSSPVIVKGKVYVTGMVGVRGTLFAFDSKGKQLWKTVYGREWDARKFSGARGSPTVDDGLVYLMSGYGRIACLDAETGKKKWHVDTLDKFLGRNIKFGISESPLIEGNMVIVTPGGKNASVVALNKKTGKTIWTSSELSDTSAYCSPIAITHGNTRQIIAWTAKSIVGLAPKTGKVIWRHAFALRNAVHANSPVYSKDGYIYSTAGYGHGCCVIKLDKTGTRVSEVWRKKIMDTHHGGVVLVGDHVYGTSSRRPKNKWMCMDLKTGAVKFETQGIGKGSVITAGGMLYGYSERGKVALAKAAPSGWTTVSEFEIQGGSGEHWAHLAIADGRLYVRWGKVMMAYDIAAKKE